MDFKGKVVVITGASSGIGKETAFALSQRGAALALVARDEERLEEVQKKCTVKGAEQARAYLCDVSNYSEVKKTCAAIKKDFKKVDMLINNAGFGVYKPFEEQEIEEMEKMMQTNFFGIVYFTKELLPLLGSGAHIMNVSSMAGRLAFPNYSAYCATKFAVSSFTESIYHEFKRRGISVHLICPVGTKTHFFDHESFKGHPHRVHYDKMMEASEVAEMIVDAIEKNRFETIPTLRERFALILKYTWPTLYHKIMQTRYVRREIEKEK